MVHSSGWKLLILCTFIIAIPALIIAAIALSRHEDHTHCEMDGCSQTLTRQTERIEAARGVCGQACSTCAQNQTDTGAESRECQFRCNCCAARERCANMAEMAGDALANCSPGALGGACEFGDVFGLECVFPPNNENCESFGFDVTIDLP